MLEDCREGRLPVNLTVEEYAFQSREMILLALALATATGVVLVGKPWSWSWHEHLPREQVEGRQKKWRVRRRILGVLQSVQ